MSDHVPTETEAEIGATLEDISESGEAQCRLCDHVVEGDGFGEILEKLAEHGESEHDWDDSGGWSASDTEPADNEDGGSNE